MKREKQKRTRIIIALTAVLLLMTVGYAAYNTNLNITGTSNISNSWDIEITNISDPVLTGSAKHVAKEIGTNKLSASMEADLYGSGDSAEYTVTIENKGNVDAALDSISKDESKANQNVDITFSNYTKGQRLESGKTIDVKVKIAYPSDTSFNIDNINNNIKLMSTDSNTIASSEIKVTFNFVQAEGYKDSEDYPIPNTYLVEYDCTTNGGKDCTEFNEYLKEGESVNLSNIGTKKGYAFKGWAEESNAENPLESKIVGQDNIKLYALYQEDTITFESINTSSTTNSITVVAKATSLSGIKKYEFSLDGENYIEGTIDAENKNSTYTFTGLNQNTSYPFYVKATTKSGISDIYEVEKEVDLTENIVTEGDGLYQDATETDRYIYKGTNPNNYITFNDETAGWRIMSILGDGTYKIIKDKSLSTTMSWDKEDNRNYSTSTYCTLASVNGCNIWASMYNIVGKPSTIVNGEISGTVVKDSSLNTYLNTTYLNTLKDSGSIVKGIFDIGPYGNEKKYQWEGYVALATASEYNNAGGVNSYLNSGDSWWLLTPYSNDPRNIFTTRFNGTNFSNGYAYAIRGVRPTIHLKTGLSIKGKGTSKEPYYIDGTSVKTSTLETPTFTETETDNGKTITIDYHKECGSNGITCTYIKNGETIDNLTGSTQTVEYTEDGILVATISDGTNTVSTSSYTVTMPINAKSTIKKLNAAIVTSGDGLYKDATEADRYIYKGTNPSNYIQFNGEIWRIYSVESDGSIKIIRDALYNTSVAFDVNNARPKTSNSYCTDSTSYGCNAWAATSNLTSKPSSFENGSVSGTVTTDSRMLTYLNTDTSGNYYNTLSSTAKGQIVAHDWDVGPVNFNISASQLVSSTYEGKYKWTGNVALLTASEYIRANSNTSTNCSSPSNLSSNYSSCRGTNWLYSTSITSYWWLLSPSSDNSRYVWSVYDDGYLLGYGASYNYGVRPALYLKSTLNFTGSGTNDSNIYKIS